MVGVVMRLLADSSHAVDKLKADSWKCIAMPRHSPPSYYGYCTFCSDYYHHPLGPTVLAALPTRLRRAQPVQPKA